MRATRYILPLCYYLVTGLIIVAPAIYNRYPLMYFDSGAYMEMAVSLEPSFHRAIGYPFLIRWTGLLVSNWPLIILQGVLLSWLLKQCLRIVKPVGRIRWPHFLAVSVLSFASAMPWYAAQLMPDIWTLILVLTTLCMVLSSKWKAWQWWVFTILLSLSLLTHLSHFPLLFLMLVAIGSLQFLFKGNLFPLTRKQWLLMTLPLVCAFVFTASYNASFGHGFRLSLASNAFVTANLGEMGILKMYLDEQCPGAPDDLCAIKDQLPRETYGYLWDPEGPVQQHPGGWQGANDAYAVVVHDFFSSPRYLKWFLFSAMKASVKQMFQLELGSGLQYAYGEGTPPYWPMREHFKQELGEYLTSVQNKGDNLPLEFFRWVNYISLFLSILVLAWAVIKRKLTLTLAAMLVVAILAYVFNAAITGVLANVYERLQVRLLPLVQLLALMVVWQVLWPIWREFFAGRKESA